MVLYILSISPIGDDDFGTGVICRWCGTGAMSTIFAFSKLTNAIKLKSCIKIAFGTEKKRKRDCR